MFIMFLMRHAHLFGVDLNLLVALDALLRERSVTRAAAEVGLSQPAMSRVLSRWVSSNGELVAKLRVVPEQGLHCRDLIIDFLLADLR